MFSPKTESRIQTAKKVVKFVSVKSVSATVVTIIHQNTETFSKSQKAQLYIGAFLVSNMVADQVWDHTEAKINDIIEAIRPKDEEPTETIDETPITEVQ